MLTSQFKAIPAIPEKRLNPMVIQKSCRIFRLRSDAVAAGTVAKLFDPKVVPSNVPYPRDLVDNARYDLSATWHDAAVWLPRRPKE